MSDPDSKDLLVWLTAIFRGESVQCKGNIFACKPSRTKATTLSLDDAFVSKHHVLANTLKNLAAETGSQWRIIRSADEDHRSAVVIAKKRDLVEVLLKVRRAGKPALAQ
jgi:hypothetical protein